MRYKQTRDQTAELLRMVLPQMARQQAGFHPLSYAVWYEYLAGLNPSLNADLDSRLAQRSSLAEADVAALYETHIALRDVTASAQVGAEIARLVAKVDDAASAASREVTLYGAGLDNYRDQLRDQIAPEQLDQMVRSLIQDTSRVRASTDTLNEHLRENSQEVARLRSELEVAQGLALRDPLTGLLNRRGFDRQLLQDWVAASDGCSLLIVDIDRFKAVNDAHGHLLGDRVIMAVARALHACAGGRGPIARIGGEEFSALLWQTAGPSALELAEQIRTMVERGRIRRGDGEVGLGGVTVSIGVATGVPGEEFEALMLRADRALYQSKANGRNRITLACDPDPGQDTAPAGADAEPDIGPRASGRA